MQSNYDKQPYVAVTDGAGACVTGWQDVADLINETVSARGMARTVLTVECYTGVHVNEVTEAPSDSESCTSH